MELSIIRLQDPSPGGPAGERRRRIRHRLHTPVYASFNGPNTGMVLDLSELLDLHEDGFAVQTSPRLEVDRVLNLSLDLPETKAHIHGAGHVVWSDSAGRGGIRFSGLPDQSGRLLKEWLFVNLLIACTNHAARSEQAARQVETKPAEPRPLPEPTVPAPVPDLSGMLSAVEAVRREVRATGDDFDAVLNLIAERALSLTGASGAALAILTDDKMICRARAGQPAPPLGAPVDVKQGLSGECVRSGRMVACEDTEADSRVDQETCRMLGIGSIVAAPIFSDFRVVGLLEVFSPCPRAFTEVHETALDRLVEIVPKVQTTQSETATPQETKTNQLPPPVAEPDSTMHAIREALWEPEREAQEPLKGFPVRPLHLGLLVLTAAIAALVLGYLLAPTIERLWLSKPQPAPSQAVVSAATTPSAANLGSKPRTPDEWRTFAEQGNADAQWNMGVRYHTGEGVLQDDAQAVQWFLRAAEQGHIVAQATLGAYYWAGRGVPQDLSKAYFWSVLALAQGDEGSKSRLEGLASQMTRSQVTIARQQAEDWLRQHHAAKAAAK
ncbi:MAG: SEL1-like repeat protein [Acidobacteriales bacterium]|nr:SEL1-like repeat protein [Terriglobales bacterium]